MTFKGMLDTDIMLLSYFALLIAFLSIAFLFSFIELKMFI